MSLLLFLKHEYIKNLFIAKKMINVRKTVTFTHLSKNGKGSTKIKTSTTNIFRKKKPITPFENKIQIKNFTKQITQFTMQYFISKVVKKRNFGKPRANFPRLECTQSPAKEA